MTAAGLYVHVPFCLTRCGYCDFNVVVGREREAGRYLRAVAAEASREAPAWRGTPFASIYVGGGTPTLVPAGELVQLLDRLRKAFAVAPGAEVTVEANPETVDERSLRTLRAGGVNRLSLGAQSFDPAVLAALDRAHGPDTVREAVRAARRGGLENVSLDLIYGAGPEDGPSWARTLRAALDLDVEHVSCYALTVEPNTELASRVRGGSVPAPDADEQADRYEAACRVLGGAGFDHYEVSNWARPGRRSVHNGGYWEGRPYLGLGAGAHSFAAARRRWNVRPLGRYVAAVEAGRSPVGGEERPDTTARRTERLLLGLRTAAGLPLAGLDPERIRALAEARLLRLDGDRAVPTEPGMLLANELVLELSG
ncbi:MAG TPA: radical SAM family heme chaperone HemW [Actinomycetota bacterium]|nr:radical SAM family heme chaperone HemW [Actinomycetota bacterium]